MPGREGSVLSAFSFPRKGPGSFLYRGGKGLPVCFVEGLLRVSFSTFDEGFRPFLFSLRVSNLSLFSSKGSVCFLSRGGKGADFPEGCVEGFRIFFCFVEGTRLVSFLQGVDLSELEGGPFPEPRLFPHPQEELRKSKGSNCLVPADLRLINDFSENERIPAFLFFFFPRTDPTFLLFQRTDPTFLLFHRRDGDWKGQRIPLFLFHGRDGFPLICCVGRGERKREEEEGLRKAEAKARGKGQPEAGRKKGSGRDSRQKEEEKREEKPQKANVLLSRKIGKGEEEQAWKGKTRRKREGISQKQEQNKRKESEKNGRETKNRKQRNGKRIGRNRQESRNQKKQGRKQVQEEAEQKRRTETTQRRRKKKIGTRKKRERKANRKEKEKERQKERAERRKRKSRKKNQKQEK